MLWAIAIAMTVAAAACVAWPLVRRPRAVSERAAYDLEVYRDQLAELDRDRARGLLTDPEHAAARAEIGRRAIAASGAAEAPAAPVPQSTGVRAAAFAVIAAAPVAALALYLATGAPRLPSQPLAERRDAVDDRGRTVAESIRTLSERLKQDPDDVEGWVLLARSYGSLDRHADAVAAWREATTRAASPRALEADLAEALVRQADGMVTPEARGMFERARAADPRDPRPRFYLGMARAQEGDPRAALQEWIDLIAVSPPDAPWLPMVRERVARDAAAARIDPATVPPSAEALVAARAAPPPAPPAPNAADVEAIRKMSPEEQQALIRNMVGTLAARLEREPNDIEGWRRLGRSWLVLEERDKAKEAFEKAVALAPERVDLLADLSRALIGESGPDGKLPPGLVGVMRRILALEPEHRDALWFVGLAEAEAGHRDAAIALWEKLVARLPADSGLHAEVKARIEKLKATN